MTLTYRKSHKSRIHNLFGKWRLLDNSHTAAFVYQAFILESSGLRPPSLLQTYQYNQLTASIEGMVSPAAFRHRIFITQESDGLIGVRLTPSIPGFCERNARKKFETLHTTRAHKHRISALFLVAELRSSQEKLHPELPPTARVRFECV